MEESNARRRNAAAILGAGGGFLFGLSLVRGLPFLLLLVPALVCCVLAFLLHRRGPLGIAWMTRKGVLSQLWIGASSLILVEIGARLLVEMPMSAVSLAVPDNTYVFRVVPGAALELQYSPVEGETASFSMTSNTDGLREQEVVPKPDGEFRVFLLGDSYTFGWGLEDEDTYVRVLERQLRLQHPGKSIRIINGGIPGYGPWQELGVLQETGLQYRPDLVLLQTFANNDASDSLVKFGKRFRTYLPGRERGTREFQLCQNYWEYRWHRWLRRHVGIYWLAANRLGAPPWIEACSALRVWRTLPRPVVPPSLPGHWAYEVDRVRWYAEIQEGWRVMEEDILAIARSCSDAGIPFTVFNIPYPADQQAALDYFASPDAPTEYELDKGTRTIESFFLKHDLHYISVLQVFREHPNPATLYFPGDGHLTAEGARLVAEALVPCVEQHLLPGH